MRFAVVVCAALSSNVARAQFPTASPLNLNKLYSPEVGNVEGIQRFGRQLRTDPDVGVGYNYRVFPGDRFDVEGAAAVQMERQFRVAMRELAAVADGLRTIQLAAERRQLGQDEQTQRDRLAQRCVELRQEIQQLRSMWLDTDPRAGPLIRGHISATFPYARPRDVAAFLREQPYASPALATSEGGAIDTLLQLGVNPQVAADGVAREIQLFHQPLVQVRVRVIEVTRSRNDQFNSVLDYISREGTPSLVNANNINKNNRSTRVATRPARVGVGNNRLIQATNAAGSLADTSGFGTLVNLTTHHINYVTELLANEFNADVVTAPEVVTLNGQNVEFVSGEKTPFPLGLTLVQGNSRTTQNFFYKHVGALVSITPRIVNWGKNHEGRGLAPLVAHEIHNWNALVDWMLDRKNIVVLPVAELNTFLQRQFARDHNRAATSAEIENLRQKRVTREELDPYRNSRRPLPLVLKTKILGELAEYSPRLLRERLHAVCTAPASPHFPNAPLPQSEPLPEIIDPPGNVPPTPAKPMSEPLPAPAAAVQPAAFDQPTTAPVCGEPILRQVGPGSCDWRPQDCTIDLEIFVQLSDQQDDVIEGRRAISNIIQVQNGRGLVMAGLIGDREFANASKTPVLGDIPWVGYLFRSKSTAREKTEVLIFVEAEVLPQSDAARFESARDFRLGAAYVEGGLRDTPLEYGMHRAGFGSYLPPATPLEKEYWLMAGRKVRKAVTEVDDVFK